MGTETTKVVLDLDNSEFVSKLRESLGLLGELGSGESLAGLSSTLLGVGAVAGVVAAAFGAVKAAINMVEAAEHIKQVNATFEMLGKSAGIAGDAIRDDLVKAAGGLVDTTEVLEAANKAMIVLGENARKMPEIMELSRKVIAVMGGELTETFEGLSRALAMGNARMLRQYGITVNADEATKKFAASIGVGVEYLDAAGKKQAIFNAAMEQAHAKFDKVDVSITATSNSMHKIGTSFHEIKELAVTMWDAIAGSTVVKNVGAVADAIHGWDVSLKSMFGHGKEQQDATAESLERQIAQYKTMIAQTSQAFNPGDYQMYTAQLKHAEEELAKINKHKAEEIQLEKEKVAGMAKAAPGAEDGGKKQFVDNEKLLKAQQKFESDILKLHQDRIKAEEGVEVDAVKLGQLHEEEMVLTAKKANGEIKKLDTALHTDKTINERQYSEGVIQIQRKMEAELKKIRMKADDDQLQSLKNLEKQNQKTAKGFETAWRKNSMAATQDLKNFAKLGDTSFNAVGKNAASAFQAMGDGSKSAGDAMKGFFFGSIGDIAIAQGTMHLLAGIYPPNPIELAEGAALLALGGALKSVGSSSGASAPSASSTGGGGAAASVSADKAASTPAPKATPHKSVAINIHGSLFETDQTRQRLMSMIRESGDYSDFNLKQVGQP